MSLQEKFQISVLARPEADDKWQDWTEASVRKAHEDKHGVEAAKLWTRLNKVPGLNIDDQVTTNMPLVMAGATDVTNHTNKGAFVKGFTKAEMKGTDDQYTGEHTDLFYGDAGGFVERNNYMDRE
jgi:hypothetical protein